MSTATTGVELRAGSRFLREAVELLSSMRFAISLLTIICIASVIGTVVKQNEPAINYVNQFGPFWADVFRAANLYTVYSAWWFLLILAFLVVSTSLCIARNTPKILGDLRNYKESVREQSLRAFHHKAEGVRAAPAAATLAHVSSLLAAGGWKARMQVRDNGTMVAARKGATNKLGYIAAHSSIVLICLGGLSDGDLMVRAQMLFLGKTAFTGGELTTDIPAENRLSASNPTFRGNILVPEGQRGSIALLTVPGGVVLQELPFDIELKKFIVEYYATGMPRLFASDIIIHDHETGRQIPARVEVNKPAHHRGVTIYQSSFDDGGSTVTLRAVPLVGDGGPFEVTGRIGMGTRLERADEKLSLEFTGLRVINVENFAAAEGVGTDVRRVDLKDSIESHLGSGVKVKTRKDLRNIGPSINYKLRDAAGQAREFHNYMMPVDLDGQRVFLMGVRDTPQENFRYLRVPADDDDSLDTWARMRVALNDPAQRERAARRYVALATPPDKPEMAQQLQTTAMQALALFAGVAPSPAGDGAPVGGLPGLSRFLETTVPEADRERISEVVLRILNGSLFELLNLTREQAGKPPMAPGDEAQMFMTQAVLSLSDSYAYPAPVLMTLADFQQLQASVFQVARAPGKTLVYLGAVLLIIGVFAMLYIRERRLWIWIQPDGEDGSRVTAAMSMTRRTLEADAEFDRLREALLKDAR
jgi:cytochrome c biogenesis protein